MRLLVNIRGCNGSGKSTVPMTMLEGDPKSYVVGLGENNKAPYLTVFPSYNWVALGTYHSNTGGMDTFKNNTMTKLAIDSALRLFPTYDILMEGVIASTVKSTYAAWFKAIQRSDKNTQILIVSFLPPIQVALDRVQKRNGGKPVKEDQILGKWRTVERNVQYFKDEGFTSLRVNTAKCRKEKMLLSFLNLCDKYREE